MRNPTTHALTLVALLGLGACASPEPEDAARLPAASRSSQAMIDDYVDRYFEVFPSRATAAGDYGHDDRFEDLGPAVLERWADFNRPLASRIRALLKGETSDDLRLDLELLAGQAEQTVFDLEVLERPARDPLFWTGIIANATVFQLVRDDRPLDERLAFAAARVSGLPRLAQQAAERLSAAPAEQHAAEKFHLAARQMHASATFYQGGFARAADQLAADPSRVALTRTLSETGAAAAAALEALATRLEALAARATGSPRLGEHYVERFRLVTGDQRPVAEVLAAAEAALVEKRDEAAIYGRSIWSQVMDGPSPAEDRAVLRRLFDRIAEDRAGSVDDFVADYRQLLERSIDFVRQHQVVTLPEPLTVHVSRSPDFFLGQGVGGVYPAGPFAPDADTLFYLPTPSSDAPPEAREALFRDFNHHFNVMITPHEMVPGHYLQLKYAARHPRKLRALFGDGVFIEGWGTFCERLMLDLGWGGPLDRVAHLKKQLENIARTIVDIRVHTAGMTRDEVIGFVREEALQAEHFAANMWTRAITSSPQLTFYWLGYEQVDGLYQAVRSARGEIFVLREFTDAVMAIGPVPVARLRQRLVPADVSLP